MEIREGFMEEGTFEPGLGGPERATEAEEEGELRLRLDTRG